MVGIRLKWRERRKTVEDRLMEEREYRPGERIGLGALVRAYVLHWRAQRAWDDEVWVARERLMRAALDKVLTVEIPELGGLEDEIIVGLGPEA